MKQVWKKASHSGTHNCVEVAREGDEVAIRDSKTAFGSSVDVHLAFTERQFAAFLNVIRKGDIGG